MISCVPFAIPRRACITAVHRVLTLQWCRSMASHVQLVPLQWVLSWFLHVHVSVPVPWKQRRMVSDDGFQLHVFSCEGWISGEF